MRLPNRYISLKDVTLSYGHRVIIDNANLTLNKGDFMVISGANGGGKTSLLRILLELQKPNIGKVIYHRDKRDINIGYLPQKSSIDARFPLTVEEVVGSGLIKSGIGKEQQKVCVKQMLHLMELEEIKDNQISEISGGQLQRSLFARAIISKPSLIVLDEPTSYLDKNFSDKLYNTLFDLAPTTTIVVVAHDIEKFAGKANRIIEVNEGILNER